MLADVSEQSLAAVGAEVAALVGEQNVLVVRTDVSKLDDVVHLRDRVFEQWGEVSCPAARRALAIQGARGPGATRPIRAPLTRYATPGFRAHEQRGRRGQGDLLGGAG